MNRNNRGFKTLAVLALVIGVAGLSVAYAAFSASLNINGTATVNSTWSVVWDNYGTAAKTGYAEAGTLTVTDTLVSGSMGTIKAPGDTITQTWDVHNKGNIDATIASVALPTLSCAPAASSSATTAQATAVCAKLSISMTYGGSALTTTTTGTLTAGSSKTVTMKLTYDQTAAVELSGPVTVTIAKSPTITYNQLAK